MSKIKYVLLGMVAVVGLGVATSFYDNSAAANAGGASILQGTITAAGSTALQPLIDKSSGNFMNKHQDVSITVQGGGSGTGLTQVDQGAITIGDSDVYADYMLGAQKAKNLVNHNVVVETFTIVANKDVKVKSLTDSQIRDIFSGKITNWKQIDGQDLKIVLIHRPDSSGTRATFTNTLMGGDRTLENDSLGVIEDSNGNVENAVGSTPGSISYLSLAYANQPSAKKSLKMLAINGVKANDINIENGTYPFWSYGHMYTKGVPNKATEAFINYISSPKNDPVIEELGYIPMSRMKVKDKISKK